VLINWEELLSIDDGWVTKYLCSHVPHQDSKLYIRLYTLHFSGTQQRLDDIVEFLANQIPKFCFTQTEIQKLHDEGKEPWREAAKWFGDIDPDSDGKAGELMLFLLVEAVLKVPLIAYKIKSLTNTNDQVKGGDGIFIGNYMANTAILLGESKIKSRFSVALDEALDSLDRFHSSTGSLGHELLIAPQFKRTDLSADELNYIYEKLLDFSTPEHRKCILVHPVFVAYNSTKIDEICSSAGNALEAEKGLRAYCSVNMQEIRDKLEQKLVPYKKVAQVYLDFFFLPLSDVSDFRHAFYRAIHLADYRPRLNK
jgi:hypothetical protein